MTADRMWGIAQSAGRTLKQRSTFYGEVPGANPRLFEQAAGCIQGDQKDIAGQQSIRYVNLAN
jgi:hypothetical protein